MYCRSYDTDNYAQKLFRLLIHWTDKKKESRNHVTESTINSVGLILMTELQLLSFLIYDKTGTI